MYKNGVGLQGYYDCTMNGMLLYGSLDRISVLEREVIYCK